MSAETKEQIVEKLDQSRRLLKDVPDQNTAESIRSYIEELEAMLLILTSQGT